MEDSELQPVRTRFRALARVIVPEASELDEEGWLEVERHASRALRSRPTAMRRGMRALIRLLHWTPVLRWGRTFPSLDPDRQRRFLEAVQDAPLLPLRQGFWGLRSLVFMGYYGRPEAAPEVGWDARLRGRREKGPVAGRGAGETVREAGSATPGDGTPEDASGADPGSGPPDPGGEP